jgi:HPt (histidine-containing phosphotransfer) domain-containing protein
MDVQMPSIDGLKATRLIRAGEQACGLPAAPAPSLDDTPVLDREALRRIRDLGGDKRPRLLSEVIEIFRREVPRQLAALELAWGRRDLAGVAIAAHSLKSSCAHVGAMRLAAACARIEADLRAGDAERAASLVEGLPRHWDEVGQEMESALPEGCQT